jgi:hypothetical protein
MCLLITLFCGTCAVIMQMFLAGTGKIRNFAEQRLDGAVRVNLNQQVTDLPKTGGRC